MHDHVDVLRLVAGLRHARDQVARRQPAFELLVFARSEPLPVSNSTSCLPVLTTVGVNGCS